MKLQDLVDDGKVSPGAVPQNFLNKNRTMLQIEISINGILKLLNNLDRITGTAHKILGFAKTNIKTKMSGVREAAYNTLVWPQLEYAAAIWDPHQNQPD